MSNAQRATGNGQRGISLVPALLVLTALFVLAAAYFGLVLPDQTRRIAGLQKSTTSTNLAETALNRAMALLSKKPKLADIQSSEPDFSWRGTHTIATSRTVYDANGQMAGVVDLAIDSGDPDLNGKDRYGNSIWFDAVNQNFEPAKRLYRFGVTAYALPKGMAATSARQHGVYAVVAIQVGSTTGGLSPSVFFLHTISSLSIAGGSVWYGPIESEGTIHFWWDPAHNQPIEIHAPVTFAGSDPDYKWYASASDTVGTPLANALNDPNRFTWERTADQPKHVDNRGRLQLDFNALKNLTNPNCGVVSDPDNGCYAGNDVADFQSTYFGAPGLTINGKFFNRGDIICINGVMDIQAPDNVQNCSSGYWKYFYRPIPTNGVILAVDRYVFLGGLPGSISGAGPATVIDGRLSIVSYTTQPQSDTVLDAAGNIVIYGNVYYRNDVVPPPEAARQTLPGTTDQFISNADGSPTGTGTVDAVGLFASHYVWVYVPNLYQPNLSGHPPDTPDNIQIFGQIIAGASPNSTGAFKNYYPPGLLQKYHSYQDTLLLFGAVASAGAPEMEYFSTRTYIFDRSLGHPANPRLPGLPLFPAGGNPTDPNQVAGVPSVVSGTWREIVK